MGKGKRKQRKPAWKIMKPRKPPPSEIKLGTQAHKSAKPSLVPPDGEVIRCPECKQWIEPEELEEFGMCFDCERKQESE